MRFLTVALYHPTILKGGAQQVAKDLHDMAIRDTSCTAALLAGIDSRIFPQYCKVGSAITALPDSETEFVLAGAHFDDFFNTAYDDRRIKAVRRFLLDFNPDIIHVHHSLWVGLDFLHLARQTLPNAKIIYTLHEYIPICAAGGQLYRKAQRSICMNSAPDQCVQCFPDRSPDEFYLRRRGFKQSFRCVDHFIAPSEYLRERFIEWGISADRITTIPNGHKSSRPTDWIPPRTPNLSAFGFFGQYVDAKGIDILLEAASLAAPHFSAPVEIIIHGGNKQYASSDYLARIERLIRDMPDSVKVTEKGQYAHENVFELMSSVDWVVVPAVWPETFALVVSEAWDARRPVIAAKAGGMGTRITDGVNGITFAPGAAGQLASILIKTAGNEKIWSDLVETISDEISMERAWQLHRDLVGSL